MMYRLLICLILFVALVGSIAAQTPVSPQTTVLQVRYKITSDLARGWRKFIIDPCFTDTPTMFCYEDRELKKRIPYIGYPREYLDQGGELVISIDETFLWDKANRRLQRVFSYDDGIYFEIHTKTQTVFWGAFRKVDFLEWGTDKNSINPYNYYDFLWKNPYDLTDQRLISEAWAARLYDGEVTRFREGNKEEVWVASPEHFKQLFAAHAEVLQAAPPRYQFTAADAQKTKGMTQFDFYRSAQKQVSSIRFEPVKRLDFGLGQVKYAIDMPTLITDSVLSAVQAGIIRSFENDSIEARQSFEEFMERLEYIKKAIRKKFPGQENNLGKFLKTYYSLPLRYFPESKQAAVMSHGIITDLNHSQPFDVVSVHHSFFIASYPCDREGALCLMLPADLTDNGQHFELASFSWSEVKWNVFEDNPSVFAISWENATLRLGFWRDPLTNRLVNLATPEGFAYFSQRMGHHSEVIAAVQNLQGKKPSEILNPSPAAIYPNIAAVSLDTDNPEAMEEVIASLPRLWGISPIGKGKLPASLTKLRNLFYINLVHWHHGLDAPQTLADWQALLSLLQQMGKPVYFLNEDSNGFIYNKSELKPLQQRLYVRVNDYQLYKLLQLPQLPPDCTRFIYELHVVLGADEEFPTGIISRLPRLKTLAIGRKKAWQQPMPPLFHLPDNIGELTTLTRLSLDNVANLPASLANLVNLEHLSIEGSPQVDVTPLNQILPALKNLESLDLHHSQVTRLLPAVRQLVRLKKLSVYAPQDSPEPSDAEIERLQQLLPDCKVERWPPVSKLFMLDSDR
ncbi:MAG: hypothetical protein NZM34_13700 [Bernardetiaceae bacterium]|nr:hypothetical protein [Bernardetiaceae bacterium]